MNKIGFPIHIIYASTSGNTEFVMEKVANIWKEAGAEIHLHRAEKTSIDLIKDNKFFLLATSTWDHGTINPFFEKLLDQMKKTNMSDKLTSFIGLGDRRYEKYDFCEGMKLLQRVWQNQGGKSLGVALTIGREPFDEIIDKIIKDWAIKTIKLYDNN